MIVFTSRTFSVEVDAVRYPNGHERHVALVRHPPSVVLIPVREDGRVVLIRQFRPSISREIWELPAGKVDPGETAEAAAARECEEEIRLVPQVIERLGSFYPSPGFCDEEMIFFRVSQLVAPRPDSAVRPDEDEDIQARAVTFQDARLMVTRGEIVDLKTAYGLTITGA
jgi:ADP-ribose pyrophosphatase